MPTLADDVARADAASFVGRTRELAVLETLFDPAASLRVVHLHGPAGIGKSGLLRELARRGRSKGWTPRLVEGRDLPPVPAALTEALSAARQDERPLLLFDTYEAISGLDGLLRTEALHGLSASARIVFASRRPPARGWSEDGWDAVSRALELGALDDADALVLLSSIDVPAARALTLVGSGGGSPLALRLLAGTSAAERPPAPDSALGSAEQVRALVRRLTDTHADRRHHDVLAVASVARVTTLALLRDALPDADPEAGLAWLASRSFAEPLGGGFTLHDLVHRSVRAELRLRDPDREHELRRRIADHLHGRATAGDLRLSIDLAHLLDDPARRWGYSWAGASRFHVDDLHDGDLDTLRAAMTGQGHARWWALSEGLARVAPPRVAVARDARQRLVGFTVSVTPANAPALAWEHEQIGPWLRHGQEVLLTRNAVVWQAAVDLSRDPRAPVQAMLGMSGILRSGLTNPRYAYLPINRTVPGALAFSAAVGARHLPELDLRRSGGHLECHLLDYGPGGILGMQRDAVYEETGARPPADDHAVLVQAARAALRRFHRPDDLAASVLAVGTGAADRAASVRALLSTATTETFGTTPDERLLRGVIDVGYLDATVTHEQAADRLHVSRSSYFRKLRAATERVCESAAVLHERRPAGRR